MGKRQALLTDLAAYRELTPERKRELLAQVPGSEQVLAAYEQQDKLLAALLRPQIPASAVARIFDGDGRRPPRWSGLASFGGVGRSRPSSGRCSWSCSGARDMPQRRACRAMGCTASSAPGSKVRLAMMTREQTRLAYERQLEERRRAEIRALLAEGRQGVSVAFTGLLQQGPNGAWTVAGLPVALPPDAQSTPDSEVRIDGCTADGRVQVYLVMPQATPEPNSYPGSGRSLLRATPTGAPGTSTPQASADRLPHGSQESHRTDNVAPRPRCPRQQTYAHIGAHRGSDEQGQTATATPNRTPAPTSTTAQQRMGRPPQ